MGCTVAPGFDFAGFEIPDKGAFQLCFVIGAGAAFAGAMVALLVPRQGRRA